VGERSRILTSAGSLGSRGVYFLEAFPAFPPRQNKRALETVHPLTPSRSAPGVRSDGGKTVNFVKSKLRHGRTAETVNEIRGKRKSRSSRNCGNITRSHERSLLRKRED